jgi:hypothetical protein
MTKTPGAEDERAYADGPVAGLTYRLSTGNLKTTLFG